MAHTQGAGLEALADGLRKVLRESGLLPTEFSARYHLGDPPLLRNLLAGKNKPNARTVFLLVSAFGEGECLGWFSWVINMRLLMDIHRVSRGIRQFCASTGIPRKAVDDAIFDGRRPTPAVVRMICATCATRPEEIGLETKAGDPPEVDQLTRDARAFGREGHDPRQFEDVVLALLDLHLAIRSGDVTPPWPCKTPDHAPFEQILGEFSCSWGSGRRSLSTSAATSRGDGAYAHDRDDQRAGAVAGLEITVMGDTPERPAA